MRTRAALPRAARGLTRLLVEGGATTLAGLRHALAEGIVRPHERIVLMNTGSGLRYGDALPEAYGGIGPALGEHPDEVAFVAAARALTPDEPAPAPEEDVAETEGARRGLAQRRRQADPRRAG